MLWLICQTFEEEQKAYNFLPAYPEMKNGEARIVCHLCETVNTVVGVVVEVVNHIATVG